MTTLPMILIFDVSGATSTLPIVITLPLLGVNTRQVNWGDGTTDNSLSHSYTTSLIFYVFISIKYKFYIYK